MKDTEGLKLSFFALLYADDTLLKEENEDNMELLLHSIEITSDIFGMKLNKDKCVQLPTGITRPVRFRDGTPMTKKAVAVYLGGLLHNKTDPRPELKRRIWKAAHGRRKLHVFWTKGTMNKRRKLIIHEAIAASKLMYGLETAALPAGWEDRIDAAFMKGIRQILGITTTFGQMQNGEERTNTNQFVIDQINKEMCGLKEHKPFVKISDRIKDKAIKLLGEAIRKTEEDPVAEVMLTDSGRWNLPMPGSPRKYRPRCSWSIETTKNAWNKYRLHTKLATMWHAAC